MNIILFDDDKWLRDKCRDLIRKCGHSILLSTDSVPETERCLKKHNEPALFFIDIMIGLNSYAGLTLVDTIKKVNANHVVVFMTAYPDLILYNTHSKTQAINIILKSKEHFVSEFTEMLKIAEVLFQGNSYFRYTTKCNAFGIIPLADILYFEKVKGRNTISIHHKKGVTIISGTFKDVIQKLDSRFLRCHNSFIVNAQNIIHADFKIRQLSFNAGQFLRLFRYYTKMAEHQEPHEIKEYFEMIYKDIYGENKNLKNIQFINNEMIRHLFMQLYHDVSQLPHVRLNMEVSSCIVISDIKEMDLFKILSIFLDNALEAVKEQTKGFIEVMIIWEMDCYSFKISNSYDKNTDKKSFGMGLQLLEKIISRYDNIDFETRILTEIYIQTIAIRREVY